MKVKRFQQEANWGSARLAAAYSRWMDQEVLALPTLPSCSDWSYVVAARLLRCSVYTSGRDRASCLLIT